MKAKIVGIEDKSYTNKTTGELVEQFEISLLAPSKSKKQFGEMAIKELLKSSINMDSIRALNALGEKAIGKTAFISKGVNKFGEKSVEYVEEFEIL